MRRFVTLILVALVLVAGFGVANDVHAQTPILSFEKAEYSFGEFRGIVELLVVLSEPSEQDVIFSYSVTGTATEGTDFTIFGTRKGTIYAGDTQARIRLTIADDASLGATVEGVFASNPSGLHDFGVPDLESESKFGTSVANLGDLDGVGSRATVFAVGAPRNEVIVNSSGRRERSGSVYILYLETNNTLAHSSVNLGYETVQDQASSPLLSLSEGDRFGDAVANLGYFDALGATVLAASAPGDGDGLVYLFSLETDSEGNVSTSTVIARIEPSVVGGSTGLDNFGKSLASLGDFGEDGRVVLAVGSSGTDLAGQQDVGTVVLLSIDTSNSSVQSMIDINEGNVLNLPDSGGFGTSVANLGDLDGDDTTVELAVGTTVEKIYILSINTADGSIQSMTPIDSSTVDGLGHPGDLFGQSLASLGDLDGDRVVDLIVQGGDETTNEGSAYIFYLRRDGSVRTYHRLDRNIVSDRHFGNPGTRFGSSFADLDGLPYLIMGATEHGSKGAAYLMSFDVDVSGAVAEDDKTLTITLIDSADVTLSGGISKATITIVDDEPPTLSFEQTEYSFDEFRGTVGLSVVRSQPAVRDVTFSYSVAGDTATEGADFTIPNMQTLTIPKGSTQTHIALTIIDDTSLVATAEQLFSSDSGVPDLVSSANFGSAVANLDDLAGAGSGVVAFAVGASSNTLDSGPGEFRVKLAGTVYILYLETDGTPVNSFVDLDYNTVRDTNIPRLFNLISKDKFGSAVANLGNFDALGATVLAASAPGDGDGLVYLFSLEINSVSNVLESTVIARIEPSVVGGSTGLDNFGASLASLSDFGGTGKVALAVGSPDTDLAGQEDVGTVVLLFINPSDGSVQSMIDINEENTLGLPAKGHFGTALANLGDLDGDNTTVELAVGTEAGRVYILSIKTDDGGIQFMTPIDSNTVDGLPDVGSGFGQTVANLGDLNGDGVVDLAVQGDGEDDGGSVYILYLRRDGSVRTYYRLDSNTVSGLALATGDRFGSSIADLGRFNGRTNLAVGASGSDSSGGSEQGAVHLISLAADVSEAATENNETLTITLINPSPGTVIGEGIATVTIVDDEPSDTSTPVITISIEPAGVARSKIFTANVTDDNPTIWDYRKMVRNPGDSSAVVCNGTTFGSGYDVTTIDDPLATTIAIVLEDEGDNDDYLCFSATDTGHVAYKAYGPIQGIDRTAPTFGMLTIVGTPTHGKLIVVTASDNNLTTRAWDYRKISGNPSGAAVDCEAATFNMAAPEVVPNPVINGNQSVLMIVLEDERDNNTYLCFSASDEAGNTAYLASNRIQGIDTTPPIITIAGPAAELQQSKEISASGKDATSSIVKWEYRQIDVSVNCDVATFLSNAGTSYTAGEPIVLGTDANNQAICFAATDEADNTAYKQSEPITGITGLLRMKIRVFLEGALL